MRCEVLGATPPDGYPVVGHYCPLHGFQRPRMVGNVVIVDPSVEPHLQRRTSYVTSERVLGEEMARAPALRGTKSSNFCVQGKDVVKWLEENKSLAGEGLVRTLGRLLEQGIVLPADKALAGKPFTKTADYKIDAKPSKPPSSSGQ